VIFFFGHDLEFEILNYDLLLTTVDILLPNAATGLGYLLPLRRWSKFARKWEGRPRHHCRHGQMVGGWKVAEGQ
jgi:hypothetical protein